MKTDTPQISVGAKPVRMDFASFAHNPKGLTGKDLESTVSQVAGFVKMMTGVANSASLSIMVGCLNRIADVRSEESYRECLRQAHPRYRQNVKRLFSEAIRERDSYRHALLYPGSGVRFFCVKDMPDETRAKYGVMTDKEYFEFWECTGGLAWNRSLPLVGSLHNKFRLSLQQHGVLCPEQTAWGFVGASVLELAVAIWQGAMQSAYEAFDGLLEQSFVESLYRPFSLARVSKAWQTAVKEMTPETETYTLDDSEERNIAFGVEQLRDLWLSPDLPFDSTIQAVESFSDDIFRTKGVARKSMRELAEMRDEAVAGFRKQ